MKITGIFKKRCWAMLKMCTHLKKNLFIFSNFFKIFHILFQFSYFRLVYCSEINYLQQNYSMQIKHKWSVSSKRKASYNISNRYVKTSLAFCSVHQQFIGVTQQDVSLYLVILGIENWIKCTWVVNMKISWYWHRFL